VFFQIVVWGNGNFFVGKILLASLDNRKLEDFFIRCGNQIFLKFISYDIFFLYSNFLNDKKTLKKYLKGRILEEKIFLEFLLKFFLEKFFSNKIKGEKRIQRKYFIASSY